MTFQMSERLKSEIEDDQESSPDFYELYALGIYDQLAERFEKGVTLPDLALATKFVMEGLEDVHELHGALRRALALELLTALTRGRHRSFVSHALPSFIDLICDAAKGEVLVNRPPASPSSPVLVEEVHVRDPDPDDPAGDPGRRDGPEGALGAGPPEAHHDPRG